MAWRIIDRNDIGIELAHEGAMTPPPQALDRRLSVAPMMDWTDRHCRYFLRLIARRALLYSEMIPTGALLHGPRERLLRFDPAERPLALQLGGCDPDALARAAELGAAAGYDEINLNVGCPSDRVQSARFGACLMAEPPLVARCLRAMRDAVALPVTVKTRLGIDERDDYGFLCAFVEAVAGAGCATVIVHARKAWLAGLSPKQNREIPPLRHELVHRLKADFPELEVIVNGGIGAPAEGLHHLARVDGVMLGRAAYHDPYGLAAWERAIYGGEDAYAVARRDRAPALALRRARARRGHAAQGDHAPHPWPVQRRARRARLAPSSVDRSPPAGRRPRGDPRRAGAGPRAAVTRRRLSAAPRDRE